MEELKKWWWFFRTPNLLLMIATFYIIRYFSVLPFHSSELVETNMSSTYFALMVFYTILIAAGGYVVNEIFDIQIDKFNRPHRIFIGQIISNRNAWWLYSLLNISAIMIGLFLSTQFSWFVYLSPIVIFSLFIYSYSLKKSFLAGNILVSALVALLPFLVYLPVYNSSLEIILNADKKMFLFSSLGYVSFAFFSNLKREIVKDVEDYEGDIKAGCNTLPIVLGKPKAVKIARFLGILILIFLLIGQFLLLKTGLYFSTALSIIFIFLPLLYLVWKLRTNLSKAKLHKQSNGLKLIMLAAILFLVVLKFEYYG